MLQWLVPQIISTITMFEMFASGILLLLRHGLSEVLSDAAGSAKSALQLPLFARLSRDGGADSKGSRITSAVAPLARFGKGETDEKQ